VNDGGPAARGAGQLAARSWELLDFLSQPTVWRAALAPGGRVQILPEWLAPPATSTRSLGAFELDSTLARARIDADDLGITRAAGAIAETGTVILDDATTSTRLSALAPWIHVAIVRRADIHRSLCAEISALGGAPYVVWCTGPSKTADVEGTLIQGVHGPGEPIALIVDAW
jgi:L-lactate dehydrogenase complex protein LldG